jgi:ATP-dependent RNA helicase DDX10/DBP4
VFFASRKQVRFVYQAFKGLKIQSLFELHGKQEMNKRTAIYYQFVEKRSAVLLATDIIARGVDFPAVDWVVQFDCPEDLDSYIHRVGRTARHKAKGNALLFLLPSEEKFAEQVAKKNIALKFLEASANKSLTITASLQKMNAENNDLMHLAKRAFNSYMKSVHVMRDKSVFNFAAINQQSLAEALGLALVPKLDFDPKIEQSVKTMSRAEQRKVRVAMLRERVKARKEERRKALWDGVSEGSSIEG